jgi:integrase
MSTQQEVYFNFINSIKSQVTKNIYERDIKIYLKFCNLTNLSDLLTISDPQKQIINYRERNLSSNSINTMLNGIYHFYEMNDVPLNKKKINMFKGEFTRKPLDKAYTHEQISKIMNFSDLRMKVIILLMASSGLRIGALPELRLRNIEKIDNLYKITVYEGAKEQYMTYSTPECAFFIDIYLKYRVQNGEKLHKNSFLIRDQFDITDIEQVRNKSKGIALNTIKVLVTNILLKSGLRTIDHVKYSRKETPKSHGFRKFYTTQLVNSKVNPEIREMLLGHKIGLTSCYYRPTEDEMYTEYSKAIDNLTIDPSNRLQRKVETLTIEKSRVDKLEEKIRRIEKMYR